MIQTANRLRLVSENRPRIFLFGLALLGVLQSQPAAAAEIAAPQIKDIRIGLANHYKVGHWVPVHVVIDEAPPAAELSLAVTVADSDGVDTTVAAPLQLNRSSTALATALVYTKIGRLGSPVTVSITGGERRLHQSTVRPGGRATDDERLVELPATSELIVGLGAGSLGLTEAFAGRDDARGRPARRVARLDRMDDLPTQWFGYESVDVLVIDANDVAVMRDLAADEQRFAAIMRWVELGGRVVVLCGGEAAQTLLGNDGPLAALAPGEFTESVRLPETGPLEHFAGASFPITVADGRVTIAVPQLRRVDGNIRAYAGRQPTELPLVVRSARGLGEVAFAGLDLNQPPLVDWPGRSQFYQALLRPYLVDGEPVESSQTLVTRGYTDLSGALRQRLGQSFGGVAPITFPVVAILAVAYLLVLGPLDYFLVHRWLRRPWVAWITFPLMVLLFGVGALALAEWRKGESGARINWLELVDVDTISGQARGTFWATLYSPRSDQFDPALRVETVGESTAAEPSALLSWWGLPGVGVGGMHTSGSDLGIVRGGYRYGPRFASLVSMPVLTSSTKSLLARWTAPVPPLVEAELVDQDGLAAGTIVNQTGRPLRNARLFYNGWGYRLGTLEPDGRIDVGEESSPRRVKTIVTQDAPGAGSSADRNPLVIDRASAEQILNLMMFYEAAGGFGFAQLANKYQAYCDLSRLLDLGRAILVAEVPTRGSRLVEGDGEPFGDAREVAVVYRFVLPVAREAN